MSTTDTDFWSAIDRRQEQDDASQRQSQDTSSDQTNPDPSAAAEASGPESDSVSEDPAVSRPADPSNSKSKSQRIREFLADHPEVRNRDVVDALAEYGVTAADVGNVRSQLRKKAEKQQRAKTRTSGDGGESARGRGADRGRAAAVTRSTSSATASEPAAAPASEIALTEIEAGLKFIEQAGGIERARQVVDLIARIRAVSLSGR